VFFMTARYPAGGGVHVDHYVVHDRPFLPPAALRQVARPDFPSTGGYLATRRAEGPDIATAGYQGGEMADVFTVAAATDKVRDTITGRGTD